MAVNEITGYDPMAAGGSMNEPIDIMALIKSIIGSQTAVPVAAMPRTDLPQGNAVAQSGGGDPFEAAMAKAVGGDVDAALGSGAGAMPAPVNAGPDSIAPRVAQGQGTAKAAPAKPTAKPVGGVNPAAATATVSGQDDAGPMATPPSAAMRLGNGVGDLLNGNFAQAGSAVLDAMGMRNQAQTDAVKQNGVVGQTLRDAAGPAMLSMAPAGAAASAAGQVGPLAGKAIGAMQGGKSVPMTQYDALLDTIRRSLQFGKPTAPGTTAGAQKIMGQLPGGGSYGMGSDLGAQSFVQRLLANPR